MSPAELKPMTPAQINAYRRAFEKFIGPHATVFISFNDEWRKEALHIVYPDGMTHNLAFTVYADTFEELLARARSTWDEFKDEHEGRTIRRMALEIIKITAAQGECSDAALRIEFSAEDVAKYGKQACADANDIAGRGPFEIVSVAKSNAA